jgi:hypothetical protein
VESILKKVVDRVGNALDEVQRIGGSYSVTALGEHLTTDITIRVNTDHLAVARLHDKPTRLISRKQVMEWVNVNLSLFKFGAMFTRVEAPKAERRWRRRTRNSDAHTEILLCSPPRIRRVIF